MLDNNGANKRDIVIGAGIRSISTAGTDQLTISGVISGSFSYSPTTGGLDWSAVPEPSSALAGLRRRRR